jgi:hypothetical protein
VTYIYIIILLRYCLVWESGDEKCHVSALFSTPRGSKRKESKRMSSVLKMETMFFSETLVPSSKRTRRHNPEQHRYLMEFISRVRTVIYCLMRFQVLTATGMNMAVFWDVAPCTLVEISRVSEELKASIIGRWCREVIALVMAADNTFETPANFYQTRRHNIPEDSHLYTLLVNAVR